jgi:hypothetical protein
MSADPPRMRPLEPDALSGWMTIGRLSEVAATGWQEYSYAHICSFADPSGASCSASPLADWARAFAISCRVAIHRHCA